MKALHPTTAAPALLGVLGSMSNWMNLNLVKYSEETEYEI